jgi:hypothetical protein
VHELAAATVGARRVPPQVPPLARAKPVALCVMLGVRVTACDCLFVIVTYLVTVSPKCSFLIVTLAGEVVTSTVPVPSILMVAVPAGASSTIVSVPVRSLVVKLIALGVKLTVIVQVSGDGPTVYG